MSKVNFVSEFNLFMRYARDNSLPMRERMLWMALFYVANDRAIYNEQTQEYEWPEEFIPVSNGELNLYCCLDKRGIETLRNSLKQRGLIDFKPGVKNSRSPAYKINYLSVNVGYKKVPNDVPNHAPRDTPNSVPNHVPNNAPNPVPNCTPNMGILGANLYPTLPPYSKYNSTNPMKADVDPEGKQGQTLFSSGAGFVDLSAEDISGAEFVPQGCGTGR